jgi:hypothetical protein
MNRPLALIYGFGALLLLVVRPSERPFPQTSIDAPSLILIAIICCACLLVSLFAGIHGLDPSASLP